MFWDSVKIIWSYCMRFTIVWLTLYKIFKSTEINLCEESVTWFLPAKQNVDFFWILLRHTVRKPCRTSNTIFQPHKDPKMCPAKRKHRTHPNKKPSKLNPKVLSKLPKLQKDDLSNHKPDENRHVSASKDLELFDFGACHWTFLEFLDIFGGWL